MLIIERAWIAFSFRLKIKRQARRRAATFTMMLICKCWNYTGPERDRIPRFEPLDELLTRLWNEKIDEEIQQQEAEIARMEALTPTLILTLTLTARVEALKEKDPAEFQRQCALAKHQSTTGERVVARQTDEYGNVVYHRPAVDYNLFLSADHIELNGKMGKGGVGKTEAKLAKIHSMKKASQN